MAGPEDSIPPPQRSTDQLVGLARGKLDRLRRRRRQRVGVGGGAALALVVIFAAVAVAQSGRGSQKVRTGSAAVVLAPAGASDTPSSTTAPPAGQPPTAAPPTTFLVVPPMARTAPVVATTVPPTPVTRPQPVVTAPPSPTTTAELASCAPADVAVTATADKTGPYADGEPIVVTTTVTNISDHECFPPGGGSADLRDGSGKDLGAQGFQIDYFAATGWKPGASSSHAFTFSEPPAIAGTYKVTVSWEVATPAPAATVTVRVN